ncbi:MAG TPA: acylphosphatase [Candidatus Limnocylindria bacterium]|nr:acylphosphatase [Candidatus Limnocylindria bacterium]
MTTSIAAAEIAVHGRVQAVGYRDYTRRRATLLGLAGYVMNTADGLVLVRAEGPRPVIEELVRALEQGPPLSRVDSVSVRWLPAADGLAGFDIRYAGSGR